MQDMTHLPVLDGLAKEIQANLIEYNIKANAMTDKHQLVALRLEQNKALKELLHHQQRALRCMIGEKVDPEVQFGEVVVVGVGGIGL